MSMLLLHNFACMFCFVLFYFDFFLLGVLQKLAFLGFD